MEQHLLEESTLSNEYLGLFRRERRRRRSACSEFEIESFLSHRKLPIQAVIYSGGRTGAGFSARWRSLKLTDVRELPLQKLQSFDWHNIMHYLILAELPPPKELRIHPKRRLLVWSDEYEAVMYALHDPSTPCIRRFKIFTDLVQREGNGEVKIQHRKAQAQRRYGRSLNLHRKSA